jgi:hypothetical protein
MKNTSQERSFQKVRGFAARRQLEGTMPRWWVRHGGRKSDKSTVIDRQAIVEEPSLDR